MYSEVHEESAASLALLKGKAKAARKNVRPVEEEPKVDQQAPAEDTIASNEERLLNLAMEKSLAKVSTFAV